MVRLLPATVGALLAVVDFAVHRLPGLVTVPFAVISLFRLGGAALLPGADGSWTTALLGSLTLGVCYVLLFLINPEGFGFGDVKLAPALGAVLGWYGWGILLIGTFAGYLFVALHLEQSPAFSEALARFLCGRLRPGWSASASSSHRSCRPYTRDQSGAYRTTRTTVPVRRVAHRRQLNATGPATAPPIRHAAAASSPAGSLASSCSQDGNARARSSCPTPHIVDRSCHPAAFSSTSPSARAPPPSCRGWKLRHCQQDRNVFASIP